MVDWQAFSAILSARNGVWTLVVLLAIGLWRGWAGLPAVMQQWTARRQAIAAEKAAEITRYAERLRTVEQRHDECEKNLTTEREQRHADVSSLRDEIAELRGQLREKEGYMIGMGNARQEAAGIVASERLSDRRDADKAKRDEPDA